MITWAIEQSSYAFWHVSSFSNTTNKSSIFKSYKALNSKVVEALSQPIFYSVFFSPQQENIPKTPLVLLPFLLACCFHPFHGNWHISLVRSLFSASLFTLKRTFYPTICSFKIYVCICKCYFAVMSVFFSQYLKTCASSPPFVCVWLPAMCLISHVFAHPTL